MKREGRMQQTKNKRDGEVIMGLFKWGSSAAPIQNFEFAGTRVDGEKRIAVITGGNSGLGYETAKSLLQNGMRVILACRNIEKAQRAASELEEQTKSRPEISDQDVGHMQLDV